MIEIEINAAKGNLCNGKHLFFRNHLSIGLEHGDILINDSEIINFHILLEIDGNDLLVKKSPQVSSILINDKRTTSTKRTKVNDIIKIGKISIKILNFAEEKIITKKEVVDKNLQVMQNGSSFLELNSLIEHLQNDLRKIL